MRGMRLFRTVVDLPRNGGVEVDIPSRVLLLGSCFAEHIGQHLADALPDGHVETNPFGVLYNPLSIAQALNVLATDEPFDARRHLFEGRDGLWHSWLHAGNFSAPTRTACLEQIEERLTAARRLTAEADLLCLTWGTAEVFELNVSDADDAAQVVANCHKELPARFARRRASINEIVSHTAAALQSLRQRRPQLRVVLTVSPYRYAGRGFHASTLTKATLHLAAEQLTTHTDGVVYFPAYEIVTDELRDYRFYDGDMLHPSAKAIDYVWERFSEWCFTPRLHDYAADRARLLADRRHRPLHTDGDAYAQFLEAAQKRQQAFQAKWGAAAFSR